MMRLILLLALLVQPSLAWAATYTITSNGTCAANQATIDGLRAGDTLFIDPGVTLVGECKFGDTENTTGTAASPILVATTDYATRCPTDGYQVDPARHTGMAKITLSSDSTLSAMTVIGGGASHKVGTGYWVFRCLEIVREDPINAAVGQLGNLGCFVSITTQSFTAWDDITVERAHHITLRHLYIHGQAGGHNLCAIREDGFGTRVLDSYIDDFYNVGFDSQAILCSHCAYSRYINNYINGGTEPIMLGAGTDGRMNYSGPVASDDWKLHNVHHVDIVRNKIGHLKVHNPRDSTFVPPSVTTANMVVSSVTKGVTTVLTMAGPELTNGSGSLNVVYISGATGLTAINGLHHATFSAGTGCSPCTITLHKLDTSADGGTYNAGTARVYLPYGAKNSFEIKEGEYITIDANEFMPTWMAPNVGGGPQGGVTQLVNFQDVGHLAHGHEVTAVDCDSASDPIALTLVQRTAETGNVSTIRQGDIATNGTVQLNLSGLGLTNAPVGWVDNTDQAWGYWRVTRTNETCSPDCTTPTSITTTVTLDDLNGATGCAASLRNVAISTSQTNDGRIQITTSAPHGLSEGHWVYVKDHTATAAEGAWRVLSIESTTSFTLEDSVYASDGANGTIRAASYFHANRGPGHRMYQVQVTNNIARHAAIQAFSFSNGEDINVRPKRFRNKGGFYKAINNYLEDIQVEDVEHGNCGVPDDAGLACDGATSTVLFGMGTLAGHHQQILHNTYFQTSTYRNGATYDTNRLGADGAGYVGPDYESGLDITIAHNMTETIGYGLRSSENYDVNCGIGDLMIPCWAGLTFTDNVIPYVDRPDLGTNCSYYTGFGATANYWGTDTACPPAAGLTNADLGYTTLAADAEARPLSSSSVYKKGGAREATDGCQQGVSWYRLYTARGLVPDPAWPAECH